MVVAENFPLAVGSTDPHWAGALAEASRVLTEIGHRVTPGLTTRILHQEYLVFGESAAALGRSDRDAGGRDA